MFVTRLKNLILKLAMTEGVLSTHSQDVTSRIRDSDVILNLLYTVQYYCIRKRATVTTTVLYILIIVDPGPKSLKDDLSDL